MVLLQNFWSAPSGTIVERARARVNKITFIFGASSLYDCLLGTFKRAPKTLLKLLGNTPEARLAKLDECLVRYLTTRRPPKSAALKGLMSLRFFTHPGTGFDAAIGFVEDASNTVEDLISDAYTGADADLEIVGRFTQLCEMLSELDSDPMEESLGRLLRGRGPHADLEEVLQAAHDDHVGCEDFSWLERMANNAMPSGK
jgi:hypothetical protein